MLNSGSLYRQLRKERHLTLQQVADSADSVSFISKFEKGDSQISFNRLVHLLGRINFSVEEFLYLQGKDTIKPINSTFMSYHPIYLTAGFMTPMVTLLNDLNQTNASEKTNTRKQVKRINKKIEGLNGRGNANWQHYLSILYQVQKLFIQDNAHQDNDFDSEELFAKFRVMTRPIVGYLLNIENWSAFEVLLFSMSHFTMPIETVHQLGGIAIKRTKKATTFPMMPQIRFDLLFGLFSTYINFRHMKWAREMLNQISELLKSSPDSNYAILLRFYQGWYAYIDTNGQAGEDKMQDTLDIFRILGLEKSADQMAPVISAIKKNEQNPKESMIFLF